MVFDWIELLEKFLKEGVDSEGFEFDREDAERAYYRWTRSTAAINYALVHEDRMVGCICGLMAPHYFNTKKHYYYEHMWYVLPEFRDKGGGIRLLKAVERECKMRGINHIIMSHSASYMSDYFKQLYGRLEYKLLEYHYIKGV